MQNVDEPIDYIPAQKYYEFYKSDLNEITTFLDIVESDLSIDKVLQGFWFSIKENYCFNQYTSKASNTNTGKQLYKVTISIHARGMYTGKFNDYVISPETVFSFPRIFNGRVIDQYSKSTFIKELQKVIPVYNRLLTIFEDYNLVSVEDVSQGHFHYISEYDIPKIIEKCNVIYTPYPPSNYVTSLL